MKELSVKQENLISAGNQVHPSVIKKVAIGVGAAALAATAVSIVAPQFVAIARPIAALAAGGIPGVAGELLLNQGLLQNITGMFGGGAQAPAGGL